MAATCRDLVDALPDSLGSLDRRDANGDFGAAYGDPPLIVRCGVPGIGASTAALEVSGVCWEPIEAKGGVVLTTIKNVPAVEVLVPDDYRTDNAWLIDLSVQLAGPTTACPDTDAPN